MYKNFDSFEMNNIDLLKVYYTWWISCNIK